MVHLGKIYTRTGDDGTTGLGDGTRVAKHDPRIEAYGTVDETSSAIGVVLTSGVSEALGGVLRRVQNDLFDVGADLSVPGVGRDRLRVTAAYTERIERWIDAANEGLSALDSFVLPGGEPAAAWLHLARTICRRAERLVEELVTRESARATESAGPTVNLETLRYLNRLSDLLFVYARVANQSGEGDVLWIPGGGETSAGDEA